MLPTLLDISATCKSRKSSGGALLSNLLLDDRSRDLCDAATVGMAGWMSQCVMSNRRTSACGHVVTTGADVNLSRCNQVRSMLLTVLSLRACASTVDAVSAASVGSAVSAVRAVSAMYWKAASGCVCCCLDVGCTDCAYARCYRRRYVL